MWKIQRENPAGNSSGENPQPEIPEGKWLASGGNSRGKIYSRKILFLALLWGKTVARYQPAGVKVKRPHKPSVSNTMVNCAYFCLAIRAFAVAISGDVSPVNTIVAIGFFHFILLLVAFIWLTVIISHIGGKVKGEKTRRCRLMVPGPLVPLCEIFHNAGYIFGPYKIYPMGPWQWSPLWIISQSPKGSNTGPQES